MSDHFPPNPYSVCRLEQLRTDQKKAANRLLAQAKKKSLAPLPTKILVLVRGGKPVAAVQYDSMQNVHRIGASGIKETAESLRHLRGRTPAEELVFHLAHDLPLGPFVFAQLSGPGRRFLRKISERHGLGLVHRSGGADSIQFDEAAPVLYAEPRWLEWERR